MYQVAKWKSKPNYHNRWEMFPGHTLLGMFISALKCAKYTCKMKQKVPKINMLLPSAHIQGGSSIFFVITHPLLLCLHLLPSELSPYPLINQVIHFIQNHELWISFLATKHSSPHAERRYFSSNTVLACIRSQISPGDYKVRSTHPISFVCSVSFSGRHISSPHQLGNRREAVGEEEEGGGSGSDQKHGVLYGTWSCFIISWSSSDTSYDGVVGSGGGVCMCVYACVQWLLDGWDEYAEPIQMSIPLVIFSTGGLLGVISSSWQCDDLFHTDGLVHWISTRRLRYYNEVKIPRLSWN